MLTRSLPLSLPRSFSRSFADWRLAPTPSVCVALAIAFSTNEACAAALGSLATSVGFLAALAALIVMKSWPANLPASALSTGGALIVVAVAVAWLWRVRSTQRFVASDAAAERSRRARASERVDGPAGSRSSRSATASLPSGAAPLSLSLVEQEQLLVEMRSQFVRVQAAWDTGDMQALASMTTPDMLDQLCFDLPGCSAGCESNCTDVVTLEAQLLGYEELSGAFLVSVEFSGLIRESTDRGAAPFREVWMLARSKQDGSGWKLARHQALL